MIHIILMSLIVGLLSLGAGVDGRADDHGGGQLTIVSPKKGEVIKGDSVEVRHKLSKETQARHIPCYVG
ncbi:hypothetical protein, partial [Nitrospira sp. BLG_2]|uniref:hypothetical protein n=1 Tax=Nitrospira sp. BLG_2 TaxID=3397507 RepID=UPI003B9D3513